ncbi:hypothetical protein [Salinicola peritrichatus]|uniref:hypothetical protein n=1 Tax=Salinicola peritrichatus TaxID=1267424 RepID=UPI0019551166|nr:hypothetical protein [Salinicola peritrichatus]
MASQVGHRPALWLGLEDYLLEHARADRQRISIFTGPVFRDSGTRIEAEIRGPSDIRV